MLGLQLVPHLIAMSTEDNAKLRVSAEKHIYDIEQRYPGFVHMKAQAGLELAFGLQRATQSRDCVVVHGYRVNETTNQREALLGCLYSALHTKPHKRAFVSSLVKRFDQQSDIDAKMLPFLVDNLAYFNYEVIGEPLFVIHTIDVFLSVHGTSVLQAFEESLLPAENHGTKSVDEKGAEDGENEEDEDDFKEDNAEDLLKRMPQNIQPLVDCLKSFHKYLLLLSLNRYLKTEFNISDSMMYDYSTSESSKVFEKSLLPLEKTDFDVQLIVQKIEGYISDCSAESLIENYIKFKRLIMKFDLKRSDDDDTFITAKLQTVSKNKGSKPTKRRSSYKKCQTSDDEDEEAEISKSKKKKTPSKKEGNSSTTPVVPVLVKKHE
ncbi:nipped-B-like protein A [Nilaparvata lugens]|uniref:nipped-B-like protein A n=1 Tax=Nilaparvata lugens TaxID=108931 RepID=UPI00193CD504|nr:nipped-B-like protein A [Nilaparvata lugens]